MLSPAARTYENRSSTKLEAALDKASKKALQYEDQIRDLEVSGCLWPLAPGIEFSNVGPAIGESQ